jgi:hypothetical protein
MQWLADGWHILAVTAPMDQKLSCSKIRRLWHIGQSPLGILRGDDRDMPAVTPTTMQIATAGEVEADS